MISIRPYFAVRRWRRPGAGRICERIVLLWLDESHVISPVDTSRYWHQWCSLKRRRLSVWTCPHHHFGETIWLRIIKRKTTLLKIDERFTKREELSFLRSKKPQEGISPRVFDFVDAVGQPMLDWEHRHLQDSVRASWCSPSSQHPMTPKCIKWTFSCELCKLQNKT